MSSNGVELRGCPFCDHADELQVSHIGAADEWWWEVFCDFCCTHGPTASTEAEAITAWNTRAATPTQSDQGWVKTSTYLSAVKGRQDFRSAYRRALPVVHAAEQLTVKWRSSGQKVDSADWFEAVNAVDIAVAAYHDIPVANSRALKAAIASTPAAPQQSPEHSPEEERR